MNLHQAHFRLTVMLLGTQKQHIYNDSTTIIKVVVNAVVLVKDIYLYIQY